MTKFFDKRDDFPFIFVRIPYIPSNIPSEIFNSSSGAEMIRIVRVTATSDSMKALSKLLINILLKGGKPKETKKSAP